MDKKPRMKANSRHRPYGCEFVVSYFDSSTMQHAAVGMGNTPEGAWEAFQENKRYLERRFKTLTIKPQRAANDCNYLDCAYQAM